MSRSSCLYFYSPDSGAPPIIVAKDHCHWEDIPFLWRLMLAEAQPAGPLPINTTGEPIEGSIRVSARDAIERVQFFVDYVAGHPLLHRLPELPVFLESVLVFLRERLLAFPARDAKKVLLVAQDGDGELCDPGLLQDLEVDWLDIQIFAGDKTYHELDDVLGFADSRYSFERWESWTGHFGLATLDHPYFTRLAYSMYWDKYLPPPDALSFRQFVRQGGLAGSDGAPDPAEDPPRTAWSMLKGMAQSIGLLAAAQPAPLPALPSALNVDDDDDNDDDEDDEDEEDASDGQAWDPWSNKAFQLVVIDGKFGLRFKEEKGLGYHKQFDAPGDDPSVLSLAAEWDEIIPDNWSFGAWVRRGAQWGVIDLRRHCRLLMQPCIDELVISMDDTPPCVIKDGRYGLVAMDTGQWSLAPEYDEMAWRREGADGAWQVRQGMHWGVADQGGNMLQPCIFDSMMADQSGNYLLQDHGWQVLRSGRAGWVTMRGVLDVACEWDEVRPCVSAGLYLVGRNGRWGMVACGNQLWVPCDYLAVAPLAIARRVRQKRLMSFWYRDHEFWAHAEDVVGEVAKCDPALANLLIAVTTETGVGVVDQAHRVLIPCVYQAIATVECGEFHDARWLYVTAKDGSQGLWSVEAGAEIFPCAYEAIDVFVAPRQESPLVGTLKDGAYRLWNLDGSPAFDAAFISLRARDHSHTRRMDAGVGEMWRPEIANDWMRGRPVRATQDVDGEVALVYVLPGQPILSEHDILVHAYMTTGDRQAALGLAKQYLDGFHCVANLETARLWAARACGHEAPPASPMLRPYPPYRFAKPREYLYTGDETGEEAAAGGADEPATDDGIAAQAASAIPTQAPETEASIRTGDSDVDDDRYKFLDGDDDEEDGDDKDMHEECAYLFAKMLDEGQGGPRDAPLALHWIRGAAYSTGSVYSTHAPTWLLLGKLLLDETAGPVDIPEAYWTLSRIDAPSLSEGDACFYRACCLRRGLNGVPDLQGARELMVRADASSVALAAPALAAMLTEMAAAAERKEARLLTREAAYYAQKAKAAVEKSEAEG